MGAVFGIVAAVIALVGLIVALGHVGYLALLNNAAKKRGMSGGTTTDYVNSRWKVAGGTAGVALLGLLLTAGQSVPVDVIAGPAAHLRRNGARHRGAAARRRRRALREAGARLHALAFPQPALNPRGWHRIADPRNHGSPDLETITEPFPDTGRRGHPLGAALAWASGPIRPTGGNALRRAAGQSGERSVAGVKRM